MSTWTEYDLARALSTGDNTGAAWYARRDYEAAPPRAQRQHREAIRALGLSLTTPKTSSRIPKGG